MSATAGLELELHGAPGTLCFPPYCAACGAAANAHLAVERAFLRRYQHGVRYWTITRVAVPFCPHCRAAHDATIAPRRFWDVIKTLLAVWEGVPSLATFAVAVWLVGQALATTASGKLAWHFWVLAAVFFVLTLIWCALAFWRSRHLRLAPDSAVTEAFSFSDNLAPPLGQRRHRYVLRDERFATALAEMNADRAVDPVQSGFWLSEGLRPALASILVLVLAFAGALIVLVAA